MIRRIALLVMVSAISLQGCKSSGKGGPSPIQAKPAEPPVEYFKVSGLASKGVLAEAEVTLHPFTGGVPDLDAVLGAGKTDMNGRYEVSVEQKHHGAPALLVVRSGDSTTMRCDLIIGCGSVPFGQTLSLEKGELVLNVGIPHISEKSTYNATVLTHLAYQLAEADWPAGDGGADANLQAQFILARANSQVASRFGVIGRLPAIDVLDITRGGEVAQATNESVRYSVLGPAILQAVIKEHPTDSFLEAFDRFTDQYTRIGLPGNSDDAFSYVEVLDQSIAILQYHEGKSPALTALASELSSARGLALSESNNQFERGAASATTGASEVDKGKSFIQDLRQIASSIDFTKVLALSDLSELIGGSAGDALSEFGVQVEAAEIISGEHPDLLLAAAAKVGKLVMGVLGEYYAGGGSPTSFDGIPIEFHSADGQQTIYIEHDLKVCEGEPSRCLVHVDLIVQADIRVTGNAVANIVAGRFTSLAVSGSLSTEKLQLTLPNAQQKIVTGPFFLQMSEPANTGWEQQEIYLEVDAVDFNIPLQLAQIGASDPLTLRGILGLQLDSGAFSAVTKAREWVTQYQMKEEEDEYFIEELEGLDVNIAGSIANPSDETFLASINLKQSAHPYVGEFVYGSYLKQQCSKSTLEDCEELEASSGIEGETDENFLSLHLSAGFKANLRGIVDPVVINVSGVRQSPESNAISDIKVTYPGNAISMMGEFNTLGGITKLDAINLDGIRIYIRSDERGIRYGALETYTGEEVGEVRDMGQWIKITYTDGEFDSL